MFSQFFIRGQLFRALNGRSNPELNPKPSKNRETQSPKQPKKGEQQKQLGIGG